MRRPGAAVEAQVVGRHVHRAAPRRAPLSARAAHVEAELDVEPLVAVVEGRHRRGPAGRGRGGRGAGAGVPGRGGLERGNHLIHGDCRNERHEPQPVRDELVVEHRGVGLDLDEVDRDRRDLEKKKKKEESFFLQELKRLSFSSSPAPTSIFIPPFFHLFHHQLHLTSAIMILRSAFANATSTPASTNSQ